MLAEFLTKLLRLSAMRLGDLCERLNFSPMDKSDILAQVGLGMSVADSGQSADGWALGGLRTACVKLPLCSGGVKLNILNE